MDTPQGEATNALDVPFSFGTEDGIRVVTNIGLYPNNYTLLAPD